MGLFELWTSSRDQLEDKQVNQLVAIAGGGQLRDSGDAPADFRKFLDHVPSHLLARYARECLDLKFENSGLVLQDIVNQIGKRLGCAIEYGRYRGAAGQPGHDGLWRFPDGHALVVEVKTSDAFRLDLETVAGYRRQLAGAGKIALEKSSMLIVVGREDTGGLEAQVRGSRHAWDVRLIGVDALIHLMGLKEKLDDPALIGRIGALLAPREYTKLDEIVELVFSAAEDTEDAAAAAVEAERAEKAPPAAFHVGCIARVERRLDTTLIRQSRTGYSSPRGSIAVTCAVSKTYETAGRSSYWFAFHPSQKELLEKAEAGYAVFGCGSAERVLMIPVAELAQCLDAMWSTERDEKMYWHVRIHEIDGRLLLDRKQGEARIDLTPHLLA